MSGSTRRWIAFTILMVALALRGLGATWWQQHLGGARVFGFPDSHSYWDLGQRIAAGAAYEYGGPDFRIFRAPGYPLLLGGLFALVGDDPPVLWARLVGAVLGTLTVLGVIWLGSTVFDRDTGLVAGGLAAVYPGAVGLSIFVLAEALFCPLLLVQLASWVAAWRAAGRGAETGWAVLAGGAAGLAVLTRPSWWLFAPFVLGCLVVGSRDRWRHLRIGGWMIVACSVVMSPWWVRNYQVAGRFVPTTLQVGASLYDGLNPEATGASNMPFAGPFFRAQKEEDAAAGRSQDGFETRLDRRLRDAALAWAQTHPGQVCRLAGHKLLRMWNIWPNAADFGSWPMKLLVATGYVPVLLLGAVGFWIWGRRGWPYTVCLFPAVYLTCLHLVFVSSIRYREPAMLAWIVMAAAVIVRVGTSAAARRTVSADPAGGPA
ncbi:MAG: hypothetical protein GXY58_06900 [Planctomycetaceae bacterium]|nr:hypothetical protein [Planctomycetaceae bacterium]